MLSKSHQASWFRQHNLRLVLRKSMDRLAKPAKLVVVSFNLFKANDMLVSPYHENNNVID